MAKPAPHFEPEMTKSGRWFVSVKTGNGPDSHIGDFETEAEAKNWILTKSKYWPSKPDETKRSPNRGTSPCGRPGETISLRGELPRFGDHFGASGLLGQYFDLV